MTKQCECGCGEATRGGRFLRGHQNRSPEARANIGAKNSIRMKEFFAKNPEKMASHMEMLRSKITPEIAAARIEATRKTYTEMTTHDKSEFSELSKRRWIDHREIMDVGIVKAVATKKLRQEQYRNSGGHGSTEWRDRVSAGITEKYLQGGFKWSRGSYTSVKNQGAIFYYRSSWELQRMQELDADPEVLSWKYEPFSITYELNERIHRYIPDFLIRTQSMTYLEEVGPKAVKESTEINIRKRAAAEGYCEARGFQYRTWEPSSPGAAT